MSYDVLVVGAGVVGLAHAFAAAKRGKRVVVVDRDDRARGASVLNFGFVTLTGQQSGDCWRLARRSREIWMEVAQATGIPILHRGLVMTARRPEAEAVIDAFLQTEMGEGCQRLTPSAAAAKGVPIRTDAITAALYSPYEIRVESRDALPVLTRWMAAALGVEFRFGVAVTGIETPRVETSNGPIEADTVILCPGDDARTLFADRIAAYRVQRCKLQMLRLRPAKPVAFGAAVMSDLGLARYRGYADLPEAAALEKRLDADQSDHRTNGVHLIAVQSADGSLVVGDSHHYAETPDASISQAVNDLILAEFDSVIDLGPYVVEDNWVGTYAHAPDRWRFTDAPDDATRIVMVTAGCGASTAFGIGEETINTLFS